MTSYSPDKIFYNVKNLSGLIYFEDFLFSSTTFISSSLLNKHLFLIALMRLRFPLYLILKPHLNEITSPLRSKINGSTIHDLSFLLIFIILLSLTNSL